MRIYSLQHSHLLAAVAAAVVDDDDDILSMSYIITNDQ